MESPPSHFEKTIRAAEGFLELEMYLDAHAELEEIEPERRDANEVLALRVKIYSALKSWELLRTVARTLALRDPGNPQWHVSWAYGARRSDSIQAARLILLTAVEKHPEVAIFHYNLACYECQLGDFQAAKGRLQRACALEPKYQMKALEEEDLEPLWNSL